jgi:hypothetical protein
MSAVPKRVTALVDGRDAEECQLCGISLIVRSGSRHHRLRRAVAGHRVSDLILLCGSGSSQCHGWAHSHPEAARALGIIIPANRRPELNPAQVPLFTFRYGWVLLGDDGRREFIPEALAFELLDVFGMVAA